MNLIAGEVIGVLLQHKDTRRAVRGHCVKLGKVSSAPTAGTITQEKGNRSADYASAIRGRYPKGTADTPCSRAMPGTIPIAPLVTNFGLSRNLGDERSSESASASRSRPHERQAVAIFVKGVAIGRGSGY